MPWDESFSFDQVCAWYAGCLINDCWWVRIHYEKWGQDKHDFQDKGKRPIGSHTKHLSTEIMCYWCLQAKFTVALGKIAYEQNTYYSTKKFHTSSMPKFLHVPLLCQFTVCLSLEDIYPVILKELKDLLSQQIDGGPVIKVKHGSKMRLWTLFSLSGKYGLDGPRWTGMW